MSFITAIGTANPTPSIPQSTIAEFMVKAMRLDEEDARKLRALYRMTGIDYRHSVIDDYNKTRDFEFYPDNDNDPPFPSTARRMELFRKHASSLSTGAIRECLYVRPEIELTSITHLIVVSCTGLYAPGLDIEIVKSLGLSSNIQRLCINFMGCYAAFNGLKVADTICKADASAKVIVVCTELCSIHFQRDNTLDNMLSNALFADGSAALLVESSARSGVNLSLESFFCNLATEGESDMAWTIGDAGFEMKLSSYVPAIIGKGIQSLTKSLMDKVDLNLSAISYFAIHPGGKKILEVIEGQLGLTKDQNKHAYEVLRQYGNMSSPTVLFVILKIWKCLAASDDQKKILSFAFGPGLTLESMLLKVNFV